MKEILYHAGQWSILVMGVIAVALSVHYIIFFSKASGRRNLAFTMQLFLCEQIVTSIGTLLFSISSVVSSTMGRDFESWNAIPPHWAILIRSLMFSAMILSTVKLSIEVARISREE